MKSEHVNTDIEIQATGAVRMSIAQSNYLKPFINDGDKEPSYDGQVYVYTSKNKDKESLIGDVRVQIKGKSATRKSVRSKIKYPIKYEDLNIYMRNKGVIFFVVLVDKETNTPLQIYYIDLLPLTIKYIINKKQKYYSLSLKKFPNENYRKHDIFLNFNNDALKQAAFVNKEMPNLNLLVQNPDFQGFYSTRITSNDVKRPQQPLPDLLLGNPLAIYAKMANGLADIPIQYFAEISTIILPNSGPLEVSINGVHYFDYVGRIINKDEIRIQFGTCVTLILPRTHKGSHKIKIKRDIDIRGTLAERITGLKFIAALEQHNYIKLGDKTIPLEFFPEYTPDENVIKLCALHEAFSECLKNLGVSADLNLDICTKEEFETLAQLTIVHHFINPPKTRPLGIKVIHLGNIHFAVAYAQHNATDCYYENAFSSPLIKVTKDQYSTQFDALSAPDFSTLDNLPRDNIASFYESLNNKEKFTDSAILTVYKILLAYDAKENKDLLHSADQLCRWINALPNNRIPAENTIMQMEIIRRQRKLTFTEEKELFIIASDSNIELLRFLALILLDKQDDAKESFTRLSKENQESIKQFPIFHFFHPTLELPNGQA